MKHFLSSLLAAAFLWPGLATAQTVGLSVPDTTASRGSVLLLPVRVDSSLTGRNVTAFQLQFQFNGQLVDPDSLILSGSLLDGIGWSVTLHRPTPDLLSVAAAGTTPLTGAGTLVFLRVRLKTDGWTNVTFTDAAHNVLNEGQPPLTWDNGSINIVAPPSIGISPNGDILAVGEQRAFSAYSGQAPYVWFTTDPAIAVIDAAGLLTAVAAGSVRVAVEDATGLRDTTDQPVIVRAMGVGVPDTSVFVGSTFDLPVSVTTLTGLGVTAGAFRLEFNGDQLTPTAVLTTGTVLQSVTPVVNMGVKGRVDVSFATATPLAGSGILFIVRFQAAATSSWSGMTFAQALFNQDMLPKLDNGSVSLASLSTIWMSVPQWTLIAGDSLLVSPGNGQAPFTWTTTDTTVARMDSMGNLIGLRSGTVRVIVRDALGAQGTSSEFQVFDGSVRIPNMVATTGGWAEVTVRLERLAPGNPISSYQLRLSYDSSLIRFDAVLTDGTLTGAWTPSFHSSPPVLTIAGATANSLTSTGVLLKVRFAVKPSLPTGANAFVRLEQLLFNEGMPFVDTQDGIVTVAGVPESSSLWSPGDGWTGQPVTLQFQWSGVAYAETYHFQVATDTSFVSLVVDDSTLTATSTSAGPLANGTVHYWRVRARNSVGAGPWTPVWSFRTVVTLAAAPVLIEPSLNAGGVNLTPMLRWHASAQAETYHVQLAEDSLFTSLLVDAAGLPDTSYPVSALQPDREYFWRVRATNAAGTSDFSAVWRFTTAGPGGVESEPGIVPTEYGLDHNYPNPFNPGTRIGFRLPEEAWVTLTIYNLRGSEVDRLVGERLPAGAYHIWWNASHLPSGMYIYRMVAGRFTSAQRMLLIK